MGEDVKSDIVAKLVAYLVISATVLGLVYIIIHISENACLPQH